MSATPKKPTYPEQYPDFEHQYDEDSDIKPTFDWRVFQALCIAPEPNHPIYGMSLNEYSKYIKTHGEDEEQKFVILRFRAPDEISFGIPILARKHRLSIRRYLATLIVLGLVTFQKDYHVQYSTININIDNCFKTISDKISLKRLKQMSKQTINLKTASRDNKGFTPSVPEWVAASVTTVASELNMSNSDMTCLCIAIGMLNDNKDNPLPEVYVDEIQEFVAAFIGLLDMLDERVSDIHAKICG